MDIIDDLLISEVQLNIMHDKIDNMVIKNPRMNMTAKQIKLHNKRALIMKNRLKSLETGISLYFNMCDKLEGLR